MEGISACVNVFESVPQNINKNMIPKITIDPNTDIDIFHWHTHTHTHTFHIPLSIRWEFCGRKTFGRTKKNWQKVIIQQLDTVSYLNTFVLAQMHIVNPSIIVMNSNWLKLSQVVEVFYLKCSFFLCHSTGHTLNARTHAHVCHIYMVMVYKYGLLTFGRD